MTLQCRIAFISPNNVTNERDSIWTRNRTLITTDLPNHRLMVNSTTGLITDLVITNVTLSDNNTVYTCNDTSATITSSVVLNVKGNNYLHILLCCTYMCTCKCWYLVEL